MSEPLQVTIANKNVFIHNGPKKGVACVIGHGASGDANSGNLPAIADYIVRNLGVTVVRYNASGSLKSRIATLKGILGSDLDELKGITQWILSGHSMGGRTACAVAREASDSVIAVVLFSYPLHPPGKQDNLRDEDLTALTCPVLIVRGTKDTFSTEPTFSEVTQRMSSKNLHLVSVDGGDHSLSAKTGRGQERFEEFMTKVNAFISDVLSSKKHPDSEPQRTQGKSSQRKRAAKDPNASKAEKDASGEQQPRKRTKARK